MANMTVLTNVSRQTIRLLVEKIDSRDAAANSDLSSDITGIISVGAGKTLTIETERLDVGQLDNLRNSAIAKFNIIAVSNGDTAPSTIFDDLLAYWRMDEASGSTRFDRSTHRRHLVQVGTNAAVPGLIGNAMATGTTNHYLQYPDTIIKSGSFSIVMWFKKTTATVTRLFTQGPSGQGNQNIGARVNSNGVDLAWGPSGELNGQTGLGGAYSLNQWVMLVCKYDAGLNQSSITVNNTPDNFYDEGGNGTADYSGDCFRIGKGLSGGTDTGCYIDMTFIYNRIITEEEKSYLYNSGAGRAI